MALRLGGVHSPTEQKCGASMLLSASDHVQTQLLSLSVFCTICCTHASHLNTALPDGSDALLYP